MPIYTGCICGVSRTTFTAGSVHGRTRAPRVAGVLAGLAVGFGAHRPLRYGFAVLAAVLAVTKPLNERSFAR